MPEEPLPFVALTILPGQFLTRPVENQLTPSDRMRLAKSEENADDQPKDTLVLGRFEYLIKSGFQVGHGQVFYFGLHRVTPGLVGASLVRPLILYPHQLL